MAEQVLLAGDTHGNTKWIETLAKEASRHGATRMVVLGDFGFWIDRRVFRTTERLILNDRWLSHINRIVRSFGIHLTVIDGNHDNHPAVRAKYPAHPQTFVRPIRSNIEWADRGACWTWSGVRFGAFGGARSIDAQHRINGVSWWPTEEPNYQECSRIAGRGHVDVLLTHEAPAEVHVTGTGTGLYEGTRRMVSQAVAATTPHLVAHGHHHVRYRSGLHVDGRLTRVEGFAHDQAGDGTAWALLNLKDLNVTDGRALLAARTTSAGVST